MEEAGPFTWVSQKWLVIYPARSNILRVPFNCCYPNKTWRAYLSRNWGGFLLLSPKPLNRCAQMPLAGQVKVLIFLLGSDISKCCKNFYYLKGTLENASHFPSLSPQRIWNIIFTTDAWSTGFTSCKQWRGKLRFSLGLSISRGKSPYQRRVQVCL